MGQVVGRHYNGIQELQQATYWHKNALAVVVVNGTLAGTPVIGMVLTGSVSAATMTIVHLGTTYAAGTTTGTFVDGENARNGANGFNTITVTTNAFFYPTVRGNATSPALFRTNPNLPDLPIVQLTAEQSTNNLLAVPMASLHSISADLKVLRANVKAGKAELSQIALATADLTLTGSEQDVAGATLTLADIATYTVRGIFDFNFTGDDGQHAQGRLSVAGAIQTGEALLRNPALTVAYNLAIGEWVTVDISTDIRATVVQEWRITTTVVNTIVKLRALKDGGGGSTRAMSDHTRIIAKQDTHPMVWAPAGTNVHATIFGEQVKY